MSFQAVLGSGILTSYCFNDIKKAAALAVVAVINAFAKSEAIENRAKDTEEKKKRAEFEKFVQEQENNRRKKHVEQVLHTITLSFDANSRWLRSKNSEENWLMPQRW